MTNPKNSRIALWPVLVITAFASALSVNAQSIWSAVNGTSANTNWSTAVNWSPNGVPGANSNVLFIDAGSTTAPGIINDVVDVNTTIQQLIFRQTNGVHNMLIKPGVTLNITNGASVSNFLAGTENGPATPTTQMITNTISGAGGTLAITSTNVGSTFIVREITAGAAGSHLSTLDMSGLDTFNASFGNLWVGVFPGTAITRPQGVLYLAKTNVLSMLAVGTKLNPSLDIGDTGSSPNSGNVLALGITNNIAADTIEVGNQRSGGTLKFNPAFTNSTTPSLYLRGHSAARVTTFNIADNSSATANIGSVTTGNVDFTGGTVDAQVGSMTIGDGQPITGSGAGTATGTLTMTAGKMDINTLEVGFQNNVGVTAANTGTVNVNGGTLTVNASMRLAFYGGSGGLSKGTLNITNGTVLATNIVAGGGTSAINMSGGKLVITNVAGTLAAPLSALSVSGGGILQLTASSGVTPIQVATLASDNSGVINVGSLPAIASYPAQYAMIAYQSGSGSGQTFTLGSLPGAFTGYVSNDNSSTIYVVITNGPSLGSVVWAGNINNLWDTSTFNWTNSTGAPVQYANNDVVTFNDTAKTNNVILTGTFTNAAWIQNNSALNYLFTGAGSVTGTGGLTLNSNGMVTLAETGGDNFSGGVVVNAGTLVLDDANCAISGGLLVASGATVQIGTNDANGALPAGSVDNEGSLIFRRNNGITVSTLISGAGSLTQNGNGTLFLAASNSYTGNTIVTAGTLALTNAGSIPGSPQINVTGAKIDVSGVPGVASLTTLNLNNANVTMVVGYLQTNLVVSALNLGGTTNTVSITALPAIASYPLTIALIQSGAGISGFNMGVGTLPAGYTGSVSLSGDTTAVLLTLTSGPVGVRPSVVWSGGDAAVTTNWSDRLNWQQPGAPTPVDNVIFNNTASTSSSDLSSAGGGAAALNPGNINNFVDTNFTVSTLTFTNGGGNYHNTDIASGSTLTITNTLTLGAFDSASALQQEYVNMAGIGGAALNVNNTNSNLQVWIGNTGSAASFAALDLSALDNFTASVSRLTVGACAVNNAVNRPSGILYLARTNTISTTFQAANVESGSTTGNSGIVLGDCNQNAGPTSYIYLGQVNTISADTIGIARQKTTATMQFNPIYANTAPYPSVTLKGFSSPLVSILAVGDGLGNSGTSTGTGDLNLNGGVVTATVDQLNVGRASNASSGTGNSTGTLEFDAGTITANTVNVGLQPVTGSKTGTGTLTVGTNSIIGVGGTLTVVSNLTLAGNVNNAATTGTLNINGGTVQAGNIVAGANGATSTINLNTGGTLSVGTAGVTGQPIASLNLSDATTLQLSVSGTTLATNIVAASISASGTTTFKISSLSGVATNVTYPLISYAGTTDPYPNLNVLPLPAGYTGTISDQTGSNLVVLVLTVVPPPPAQPVHITGISISGTTLNLTATNGVHGGQYVLLGTTNVTKSLSQWTPLLTNNFDGSGNLNLSTNIINPLIKQQFLDVVQ